MSDIEEYSDNSEDQHEPQESGALLEQRKRTCINFKVPNADVRYHDFGWISDWNGLDCFKEMDVKSLIDKLANFCTQAATDIQTCRQQYGSAITDIERKCLIIFIDGIKHTHMKYREQISQKWQCAISSDNKINKNGIVLQSVNVYLSEYNKLVSPNGSLNLMIGDIKENLPHWTWFFDTPLKLNVTTNSERYFNFYVFHIFYIF